MITHTIPDTLWSKVGQDLFTNGNETLTVTVTVDYCSDFFELTCQFSPAGKSPIQPFLGPFEHNLGQKGSIKRLLQPTLGPILALGPNQPQLIGLYWP